MPAPLRHLALIGKFQAPAAGAALDATRRTLEAIRAFLASRGATVSLDTQTAEALGDTAAAIDLAAVRGACDAAVVVGGDGTMLGIGRRLAPQGIPLIGINQGRLGFMTDIALADYETVLPPMLDGDYVAEDRALMHGQVLRDGAAVFDAFALNDVVVNRGATAGMVELRVEVDGHFVASHRADGLIVASPTGSTAYALSAGGPLLHPSIAGWAMVPIAPHHLSNRPIVVGDAAQIAIEVAAGRDVSASFDMQSLASLQIGDRVVVVRSQHAARFLHPPGWSYFATLRKKLHWNEGGA